MSRYPYILPSELSDEQRPVYQETMDLCQRLFGPRFLYADENESFVGPFAPILSATPALLQPYVQIAVELSKFPEVPPSARETAILTVGSVYKAGFELYAHTRLAKIRGLLSQEKMDSLKQGTAPHDLTIEENQAFVLAKALAHGVGPLSDEIFQKTVGIFGKRGALVLIQYICVYSYTCILLNAVAAPIPK